MWSPAEQVSRSLFADTPVGGIVAQEPQEPISPESQAGAPALLSHETSSVTVRLASGSQSAALAGCCVSLMCMLSMQSDVDSPASPVMLVRQPEELGTVSSTPTLFIRSRSRCQQVAACPSVITAAHQRQALHRCYGASACMSGCLRGRRLAQRGTALGVCKCLACRMP